jgi:hypothetical protein
MGDKSPKAVNKKSGQKQNAANAAAKSKNQPKAAILEATIVERPFVLDFAGAYSVFSASN